MSHIPMKSSITLIVTLYTILMFLSIICIQPVHAKLVKPSRQKQELQTNIAYAGSHPRYIGRALQACNDEDACWQITLVKTTRGKITDLTFCNGDPGFNYIWKKRVSACAEC